MDNKTVFSFTIKYLSYNIVNYLLLGLELETLFFLCPCMFDTMNALPHELCMTEDFLNFFLFLRKLKLLLKTYSLFDTDLFLRVLYIIIFSKNIICNFFLILEVIFQILDSVF